MIKLFYKFLFQILSTTFDTMKMLSLKTLSFLKVSALKLPFEDIPGDLQIELKKMKMFNGTYVEETEEDEKRSAMTVQYRGDKQWVFQIIHTWPECSEENCSCSSRDRFGRIRKSRDCRNNKQGVVELVLIENKEVEIKLEGWRALVNFGPRVDLEENMRIYFNEELAKTVITVDESAPDTFTLTSTLPGKVIKSEYQYENQFQMNQSANSRCLRMKCPVYGGWSKGLELYECTGRVVSSFPLIFGVPRTYCACYPM